jgi:FkbM family methyltransferase
MIGRQLAVLARPGVPGKSGVAKLCGHRIHYPSLGNLVFGFEELFVADQYAFRAATNSPRILDGGSNIGLSVLYFKLLYPHAKIVAFEPEPETAEALCRNITDLDEVTVVNKALAGTKGELVFYGYPSDNASLRASVVRQAGMEPVAVVEATPISPYVDGPIDLLKLDVEGNEVEVLEELARSGKLGLVRQMIVEVHQYRAAPDSRLSRLLALLDEHRFDYRLRAPYRSGSWLTEDILLHASGRSCGLPSPSAR